MRIQTVSLVALLSIYSLGAQALPITYTFSGKADVSVTDSSNNPLSNVGGLKTDFFVTISGLTENVSGAISDIRKIQNLNATFKTLNFEADLSRDVYVFSNNSQSDYFILGFGNAVDLDLLQIVINSAFDYDLSTNAFYSNTGNNVGLPFLKGSTWLDKEIKYDNGGRIKISGLTSASFDALVRTGGGDGGGNGGGNVPEPAILAMLGIGFIAMTLARRRTKQLSLA